MGIVQGLTEFLPISSSGPPHPRARTCSAGTTRSSTSLAFSVMLHMGTLVALLLYFRRDWLRLVPAGFAAIRDRSFGGDPDRRLAWLLAVATIPARHRRAAPQRPHRDGVPRGRPRGRDARRRRRDPVARRAAGAAHARGSTDLHVPRRARHRRGPGARPRPGDQPLRDLDLGRPVRGPRPRAAAARSAS